MSGDELEWIDTPVGRTSVFSDPIDPRILRWSNEHDIRDGIAALAWIHGWEVAIEVRTVTGSYCDVLLTSPRGFLFPIELKTEIHTLGVARRAFQQADDYRRHFTNVSRSGCQVIVAASTRIDRVVSPVADLHPHIRLTSVGTLMSSVRLVNNDFLEYLPDSEARDIRATALDRRASIDRLAGFAREERMYVATDAREMFLHRLAWNYPAAATMLAEALAS